MTIASAPHAHELAWRSPAPGRSTRRGRRRRGCAAIAAPRGHAAGEHDMADPAGDADVDQLEQLRVQRDQIDAERAVGSARRWRRSRRRAARGDIEPEAMTPNPPAFEIAATRLRSDTQVIAPPMIASSVPRKARPRAHSRSSSAPAARRRPRSPHGRACGRSAAADPSVIRGVEPVGGMQRAQRELGVFGRDQHADLDLGGRDHLDVDALVGQRLEHLLGDAGMAAHADADDRDLDDVRNRASARSKPIASPLLFEHRHGAVEIGCARR